MKPKMESAFQFIEHSLFTLLAAADPELHAHLVAYVNAVRSDPVAFCI